MTDKELHSLPKRSSKFTLMPYSYFRLSSQSGYGAGKRAPAYFELMWECLNRDELKELPARYLSLVARELREHGTFRSTAEVIEGVRLAETLSAQGRRDGFPRSAICTTQPDSAGTGRDPGRGRCSGQGRRRHLDRTPAEGGEQDLNSKTTSSVSWSDSSSRSTASQRSRSWHSTCARTATPRPSSSVPRLGRSSFLHRLRVLDIGFAEGLASRQQSATWAEKVVGPVDSRKRNSPRRSGAEGETVELAVAFKFISKLEECSSIADAASMTADAIQCCMPQAMDQARARLQELAAGSSEFTAVAHAANQLGMIARYGDVRRFDPAR